MSISLVAIDQGINIACTFILMQVLKKIDQTNPVFLLYLQIAFISTACINFFFLYLIQKRIVKKDDKRILKVKKVKGFFEATEDDEDEEDLEMTYSEYDQAECTKILRSAVLQFIVIFALHYKWRICQPLFVQSLAPFKSLLLNPLYICYLRGKEILRPYEKNMLFEKVEMTVEEKKRKKIKYNYSFFKNVNIYIILKM
ncbi:phosphate transporter (Pho88) [Gurleya vavrai]